MFLNVKLGLHKDHIRITPLFDKVDQYIQPTTIEGLQEFVGMVNMYHRCDSNHTNKITW